jgi:ribosomal protein S18 acetylase RimI-like enzyme
LTGQDSVAFFERIAELHAELIHGGILPLLGTGFLATLYREIAKSRWGSVHVAVQEDEVTGFIVGAEDIWRLSRGFTAGGLARMGMLFLGQVWRPRIASKVLGSLAYPFRASSSPEPSPAPKPNCRAELLSIAVSPRAQGQGVGKALVSAYEETLRGKVEQYTVTTNVEETDSNAFYSALGFERFGQKRHHDLILQVYIKQLPPVDAPRT